LEGTRQFAPDTEQEDGGKKHRKLGTGDLGVHGPKTGRGAIDEGKKNNDTLKQKHRLGFFNPLAPEFSFKF
jgi:hypothetical protein